MPNILKKKKNRKPPRYLFSLKASLATPSYDFSNGFAMKIRHKTGYFFFQHLKVKCLEWYRANSLLCDDFHLPKMELNCNNNIMLNILLIADVVSKI